MDTGSLIRTIQPSPTGGYFGSHAMAAYGDYALISQLESIPSGASNSIGQVFLCNINTGAILNTFVYVNENYYNSATPSKFGRGVAINDRYIAIGDVYGNNHTDSANPWGSVRIYDLTTYQQIAMIPNPYSRNTSTYDLFGVGISMNKYSLIVSAPQTSINSGNAIEGSVVVFDGSVE